MKRTGITSRITIVIILVAVISAGLTGYLAYLISRQQFADYVDRGTMSMGDRIVAEVQAYYDAYGTLAGIQNNLEYFPRFGNGRRQGMPGMGYGMVHREVIISDINGAVVADTGRRLLGEAVEIPEQDYTVIPVVDNEEKQIATVYIFNPLKRGVLSIENEFINNISRQTTNAIIIIMALALFIGILLARRITRPINELSSAIHSLSGGNLDTRVEPAGDREFQQLAEDFNYMAQKLYEHEQRRNSLVANIAHELRTPLSILRGHLEGIQSGSMVLTDEVKTRLVDEIIRLTRLVKELETVGLAESGALRLNLESIAVEEVVERLLPLRLVMEEEGIIFESNIDEGIRSVQADVNRLTQVLINLLSNAMRHTANEAGEIKLDIRKEGDYIQFSVSDNGPGIPKRDLPYIFDRFYRTDEARSREEGGSGLGLAIAKSYVGAHGGNIWAESEEGRGTTFYFTLP